MQIKNIRGNHYHIQLNFGTVFVEFLVEVYSLRCVLRQYSGSNLIAYSGITLYSSVAFIYSIQWQVGVMMEKSGGNSDCLANLCIMYHLVTNHRRMTFVGLQWKAY